MSVSTNAREPLSAMEILLSMHAFTTGHGVAFPLATVSGMQTSFNGMPYFWFDRFRAAMTGGESIKVVMLRYVEIQTIGERMR